MAILAIHPVTRATLLLALVLAAGAVIVWLLTRLRGGAAEDAHLVNDSLTKFRDLHARGGLSDEEYRTIKTKLAAEVEAEAGESSSGRTLAEDAGLGNPAEDG